MNKYLTNFNIHTHSHYCDGKGQLSDYVNFAIHNEIDILGFSSHAPVEFNNHFSINPTQIQAYVNEIQSLNLNFKDQIQLFAALECDYIPHFSLPFSDFKTKYHLNYIIGGIHLVENTYTKQLWFIDGPIRDEYDRGLKECFDNDIRKGVTQYFHQMLEMIQTQHFDVLAHLDKIKMHNANRYFSENEKWYQNLVLEVIEMLKNREIIVEINTRGLYKNRCPDYYPSKFILEHLLKNKVRITLSSDAHQPEELRLLLDEAALYAKSIGYTEVWKPTKTEGWVPFSL